MNKLILKIILIIIIFIACLIFLDTKFSQGNEPLFFSDADHENLILEYSSETQIFDRITTSYTWDEEVMGNGMTPEEYKVNMTVRVK